jgi:hypothetical protein
VAFSPTFLAHGHYVTTDVAGGVRNTDCTYFFIQAIEKNSWKNLGSPEYFSDCPTA